MRIKPDPSADPHSIFFNPLTLITMKPINIQQALIIKRQDDIIVKIINNKWAIVKTMFTNGKYEKELY